MSGGENMLDRIHILPLPTPFNVGRINAYLIEDSRPLLIDTGVRTDKSIEALEQHLQRLGYAFSDIDRILITHTHYDHIGSAAEISKRCQAPVFMHSKSVHQLLPDETYAPHYWKFFETCQVAEHILKLWMAGFGQWERFSGKGERFHEIVHFDDGDVIDLDGGALNVLHTPGHCPEHVCFVDAAGRFAFTGDHLLPDITPNPLLFFDPDDDFRRVQSLMDYMGSIDRLEKCAPERAYPGHGDVIDNPKLIIAQNRVLAEKRKAAFLALIVSDPGINIFDLTMKYFGELDPFEVYLAVSECVGYLDWLKLDGLVSLQKENGVVRINPL